jgi:hypothetical protein
MRSFTRPTTSSSSAVAAPAPAPAATAATAVTSAAASTGRGRARLIAAGLVIGPLLSAGVRAFRPGPERDDFSYASFAAVRDWAWLGAVIDHLGFVVLSLALPLAVCLLVRARGARLATIGSALVMVGGMFFASGFYSYYLMGWYATAPEALSVDAGTSFMSYIENNLGHLLGPQAAGFLAFNIGTLLLCAALWRSRSVPRGVPAVIAVLTVGQFLMPGAALDVAQTLFLLSLLPVAWFAWRRADATPAGDET